MQFQGLGLLLTSKTIIETLRISKSIDFHFEHPFQCRMGHKNCMSAFTSPLLVASHGRSLHPTWAEALQNNVSAKKVIRLWNLNSKQLREKNEGKALGFKILWFLRMFTETKTILLLCYEGLWSSSMSAFPELKCVPVLSDECLFQNELIIGWIGTRMFCFQTSGRHSWSIVVQHRTIG